MASLNNEESEASGGTVGTDDDDYGASDEDVACFGDGDGGGSGVRHEISRWSGPLEHDQCRINESQQQSTDATKAQQSVAHYWLQLFSTVLYAGSSAMPHRSRLLAATRRSLRELVLCVDHSHTITNALAVAELLSGKVAAAANAQLRATLPHTLPHAHTRHSLIVSSCAGHARSRGSRLPS